MKNSSNKALLALTTAALSLPGMVPKIASAQTVPEDFVGSYRFSKYQETDQPASLSANGAVERFDISVHQLSLSGPISSNAALNVDIISETLSGASPWFIVPDADGEPVQTLSGATIDESRQEISVSTSIYREKARYGIGVSYSTENDYESLGLNLNHTLYFNNNNTTFDVGLGGSADTITPTQEPGTTRATREDKNSISLSSGISQVISKTIVASASVSYTVYDGFLSDPYKLTFVAGDLLADNRPDNRKQSALTLQLRKFLPGISTALHTDYRYYADNFGIDSHTFSVGTYTNINSWQLSAKARWYDQSEASFYSNFYTEVRGDGFYSSDYRLSEFDALSFKVGVKKSFGFGGVTVSYETYGSNGDGSNPGLVDFDIFTAGLDYKF